MRAQCLGILNFKKVKNAGGVYGRIPAFLFILAGSGGIALFLFGSLQLCGGNGTRAQTIAEWFSSFLAFDPGNSCHIAQDRPW